MKHRHENDALSVDRLVCELRKEDKVIIAYKPQGQTNEAYPQLREESFLLVIMTNFQAEMYEKHSNCVVCIDSTHNTNPNGFKLVTIVVPDEFKNGIYMYKMNIVHVLIITLSLLQVSQWLGRLWTEKMYTHWKCSSLQ